MINYRRKDWHKLYKELYMQDGYTNSSNQVWQMFQSSNNPLKPYFQDKELFLAYIASYTPKNRINSTPFVINWYSTPVYATWSNWSDGIAHWDLPQWRLWYIELKDHFGKVEAQKRFINAWTFEDNKAWGFTYDGMYYVGGYDCDFINFFRYEGLDVALWGAENTCTLVNVFSNLIDATENVSEGAVNVTQSISTVSKLVPWVVVIGGALTIYNQLKK